MTSAAPLHFLILLVASWIGRRQGEAIEFWDTTGSGSPSSASSIDQTPQGSCSSDPKLSGRDLTRAWTFVAACGISTNSPANWADATVT